MKFINIVKYSLATVALTLWSSCDFKDLNDDPSKPKDVPVNTLLPSIEGEIAYSHGGEFSRYTSMFTQHAQGFNRQWVVLNAYGLSPDDVDNVWRFSVYSALMDLKQLTTKADADGYNNYSGIGRVLTAYYLMLSTDHFGDMPYSEAFQGTDNLQPKFDSQEDIYKVIDRLLSEAIQYLGQAAGPVSAGGSVDLIYGGDIAKWKAFASAVQARMYLHLGKRDSGNYQKALSSINASGWTSGGKDARYPFGASGAAPWYQFNEQRGDIEIGAKMVELMTTLNDPRDPRLIEIAIRADAFCHSMVRSIVGALLAVGEGRLDADELGGILQGAQRVPRFTIAPAHGLALVEVAYPPDQELASQAQRARRFRGRST